MRFGCGFSITVFEKSRTIIECGSVSGCYLPAKICSMRSLYRDLSAVLACDRYEEPHRLQHSLL